MVMRGTAEFALWITGKALRAKRLKRLCSAGESPCKAQSVETLYWGLIKHTKRDDHGLFLPKTLFAHKPISHTEAVIQDSGTTVCLSQ